MVRYAWPQKPRSSGVFRLTVTTVSPPSEAVRSPVSSASPAEVLLDVLVVRVAAKLAAEVAERLAFPVVVAEIAAGMVVGPSVLGLVTNGPVLTVLGELGIVLLLLDVGLQLDLAHLGSVARPATAVAAA